MKRYSYMLLLCLLATGAQAQVFPDFSKAVDFYSKSETIKRPMEREPLGGDPETGILQLALSVNKYFEADTVEVQIWYEGTATDLLYYMNYDDFKASKSFNYPVTMMGEYYFRITSPKRACFELLLLNAYGSPVSTYSKLICPD